MESVNDMEIWLLWAQKCIETLVHYLDITILAFAWTWMAREINGIVASNELKKFGSVSWVSINPTACNGILAIANLDTYAAAP